MSESDAEPATGAARSGLIHVLGATAVAGAIGYVIQAVVPAFTAQADYVAFSVFWSAVYLVVSALSGLQQEVTRAASGGGPAAGPRAATTLARFTAMAAATFAVIVVASYPLWGPAALKDQAPALLWPLVVATIGYTAVAVLSGAFYGLRHWNAVAGMTVADAALRLVFVIAALGAAGGLIWLGWAVALPFVIAAVILVLAAGRRVRRELTLDVPLSSLARNSLSTVAASIATGVLISGLPLVLGLSASGLSTAELASLILVITLTRAPLVVPMLALQSYLVVTFRDAPSKVAARVTRWGAALLGVTGVLAAAASLAGPWLIGLLYGDRYPFPPIGYAAVIVSAGLTALLCLTGPAALAAQRHGLYVSGWALSSAALVVGLALPLSGMWGVLVPVMVAPLLGVVPHLWALRPGRAQESRV